jgi:hypothetical protein
VTDIDYESEIKKAELSRIKAETARINSEREKIDHERTELISKSSQKWWNIRASGLIQSAVGGIVAGALVAGFGLDHFLKVTELNEKSQKALTLEKEEVEAEKKDQEEKSRQVITSLSNENKQLQAEVDMALQKIAALSSASSEIDEEIIRSEIATLKNELQRVKSVTELREESLSTDLKNLVQEHKITAKGAGNYWFPVIASPYNKTDLLGKLEELENIKVKYPLHVYETADKRGVPVYAITLGGYLTRAEAAERVSYARLIKIAPDAYPWSSSIWGSDIRSQVEQQ